MARRRNLSQPWARPVLGAIALLGTLLTGYLTVVKLTGGEALCPSTGCNTVLSSSYADVFGLPLALLGCLAYASMALLALVPLRLRGEETPDSSESIWETRTWMPLFLLSTAMAFFSGYLVYVLTTQLQAICLYCWASALFSLLLWVTVLVGRSWEDRGGLIFNGTLVTMGVLLFALSINSPGLASQPRPEATVTAPSSPAALALAQHLSNSGAVMYGAYWCPHCQDQKKLFGIEGAMSIPYVECDASGPNAEPQKCRAAGIDGFPTWKIEEQTLSGTQTLEDLAEASGYQGSREF